MNYHRLLPFALIWSAAAVAQTSDAVPVAVDDETIVVTGASRNREAVRRDASTFIRQISATSSSGQYARWNNSICGAVIGLEQRAARRVLSKINGLAQDVGAKVGEANCKPNVIVVFAADSQAWFSSMGRKVPQLLRESSLEEKRLVRASTAPVRWWYNTKIEGGDGEQMTATSSAVMNNPGGLFPTAPHLPWMGTRPAYSTTERAPASRAL